MGNVAPQYSCPRNGIWSSTILQDPILEIACGSRPAKYRNRSRADDGFLLGGIVFEDAVNDLGMALAVNEHSTSANLGGAVPDHAIP